MKKKLLVTACSMEVGGIERSLAGMLGLIDYERYDVDLLLFSRKGEFLPLLDSRCNLLPEIPQCASLLKPVKEVFLTGHLLMGVTRTAAKIVVANRYKHSGELPDAVVFACLQAYWDSSAALLPGLKTPYDAAISFMWPHHYVAKKVRAKRKIAWVHTDYSKAALNNKKDLAIWQRFDKIAAVSSECGRAFTKVYPSLAGKMATVENILSAGLVRKQAEEFEPEEMRYHGYTRLLTTGRFCYAKAFDIAVDICKILVDRGEKIKWYTVGYGSEVHNVEKKIAELGLTDNFILLGKKLNPYPYMKSCDIYVQPSRYEGKAVTVREAQMLGRPVVITDYPTARGQVRDGFDALISPMNAESVAEDIRRLMTDSRLRETLASNAYGADYSCDRQIEEIYKLIEG